MKAVYIAGPYTIGDVAVNVRENIIAADMLVEMGFLPYPPLHTHFWHMLRPHDYEYWMELDKEWILRCDALFRLPGASKGADREVAFARVNNIPVFFNREDLIAWGRGDEDAVTRP